MDLVYEQSCSLKHSNAVHGEQFECGLLDVAVHVFMQNHAQ
jgi:hypothetical protein